MQHDPEMIAEVRAWLHKAERDIGAGDHDLTAEKPFTEDAVYRSVLLYLPTEARP